MVKDQAFVQEVTPLDSDHMIIAHFQSKEEKEKPESSLSSF